MGHSLNNLSPKYKINIYYKKIFKNKNKRKISYY